MLWRRSRWSSNKFVLYTHFSLHLQSIMFSAKTVRFFLVQGMTKTKTNDKCLQSKNIDALQTASTIRRNYAAKLEQVSDLIVAC